MNKVFGLQGLAKQRDEAAPSAVTIGTFDGVHVGHRVLIARAMTVAAASSLRSVAVTWDRHPMATLRPDKVPPLLTPPERKVELLEGTGVDVMVELPFDEELSRWAPERFAERVLATGVSATAVIVGDGWRFGHKAAGDVALLADLGRDLGFTVEALPLTEVAGEPVSSSRVRAAVAAGDMDLARMLLGRPFDLSGQVIHGDDRGAELGFPTANVAPEAGLARPPRGVYAGRVRTGDDWYQAAINVGVNPTFGGDPASSPVRVEAYLLDFDADLYGEVIRTEFWARLRDERKFESVEDLIAQMKADVEAARSLVPA